MNLVMAGLCCSLPLSAFGGRLPTEWDDLPQVVSLSFSSTSVGLTTFSGQYFVLDRISDELRALDKHQFMKKLGGKPGVRAAEVKRETGVRSIVVLPTSSGRAFTTQNAYCSEGDHSAHALWLDRVLVKDHAEPCSSISAVEIVDNQLWLGTRSDGEYGDYAAEGVVVQSLDTGQFIARVGTKQSLTGNLVRIIRVDPYNHTVWVATHQEIDEIDRAFRVSKSLYFYQDFDPQTHTPTISVTPSQRRNNPLATLFKQLRVSDSAAFYEVAVQIPQALREQFAEELNTSVYAPDNAHSLEESFAPREMNVLVPFFIEAARSPAEEARGFALFHICAFNDRRVRDLLVEHSKAPWLDTGFISECVGKYVKFGLMHGAPIVSPNRP